jgi:predicted ATPase
LREERARVRRFVLTGTPGAGKTAALRLLEHHGHPVVEEAATDVIALRHALGHPDSRPDFIDAILRLQRRRETAAPRTGDVFFDRSPVCTLALSRWSGLPPSDALTAEIARLRTERTYEPTVFFVRNQGFVERTAARRISLADALRFERFHEDAYRELGFDLIEVPPGPLAARVALIEGTLTRR